MTMTIMFRSYKLKMLRYTHKDAAICAYKINKNSENEQRCGKRNEQITQKNATNNKEKSNK